MSKQNRMTRRGYQRTVIMESTNLTDRLKARGLELGFDVVGITAAAPSSHAGFYREWIAAGRHGEMHYLARPDAVERRVDSVLAWPELRSAIVVGLNYYSEKEDEG